jgi:YegS/Rv2252/BmrU family lipid kinase
MSLKKHLVFIVNPRSGVERRKEIRQAIEDTLDQQVYTYSIQETSHAGHGEELARDAAQAGAYSVVAVGGDGSVNDILRGLYGSDTLLSIIPKGSGNGMARTLGIPLDVRKAIQVINHGVSTRIDIAFADDKLFVSNAGVGFDALISKKFSRSKRRGLAMYSWLVTKYLWLYREWEWDLEIDGKSYHRKAFLINVANGTQFGYDFKIAPDANWTDGLLDVIIIRKFPKILGGLMALRLMKGSILQSRFVERIRGREITIANPSLKLMQTDGDARTCDPVIRFRIRQQCQGVIVP